MAGQCHRTRARARSKSIYGLAGKLWHFYGVAAKNLLGSKGTCHIKADNLHDSGFRGKWNSGYEWRTYRPFFLEQSHFCYADTQLMIVLESTKNDKDTIFICLPTCSFSFFRRSSIDSKMWKHPLSPVNESKQLANCNFYIGKCVTELLWCLGS